MYVDKLGRYKGNDSKNDNTDYNKTQEAYWDLMQGCPVCERSTNNMASEDREAAEWSLGHHQKAPEMRVPNQAGWLQGEN